MSKVKRKGNNQKYHVRDPLCIGYPCFAPGKYQHRGATGSRSKDSGASSHTCMTRAYWGCPRAHDVDYSRETEKANVLAGWSNVAR